MLSRQRVILDTDIDSDVDDVGALAMLLNLHKEGCVNLLGVITTSDDPYAPVCVSSINNWYGYPDLPVGFNMGQPFLVGQKKNQKVDLYGGTIPQWERSQFFAARSPFNDLLYESL